MKYEAMQAEIIKANKPTAEAILKVLQTIMIGVADVKIEAVHSDGGFVISIGDYKQGIGFKGRRQSGVYNVEYSGVNLKLKEYEAGKWGSRDRTFPQRKDGTFDYDAIAHVLIRNRAISIGRALEIDRENINEAKIESVKARARTLGVGIYVTANLDKPGSLSVRSREMTLEQLEAVVQLFASFEVAEVVEELDNQAA